MKGIQLAIKILFAIFFVICIAIHVIGLFTHITNEPLWSHIVYTISYSLCLLTVLSAVRYRFWIYLVASCYPWAFHANCAWRSYADLNILNPICLLVVVMMPLAALFIWNLEQEKAG